MAKLAIIGARIAGCTAVLLLHRQGHEITLFEIRGPHDKVNGAGLLLQPVGQATLQQLGLLPQIERAGA
jgi:2-polyprenyl-6-methoxyphenol hydroxylase-like FAD-dependent oxidoreductase